MKERRPFRSEESEAEVRRLELAVSGYRRDVDNCLRELKHKNAVLRDRDGEIDRLQADNERMRRGIEHAARVPWEGRNVKVWMNNLLAGREWSNSADGAKGESK